MPLLVAPCAGRRIRTERRSFGLERAVVPHVCLDEKLVESLHDNQSDAEDNRRCNNYREPMIQQY